ncbi:MAG: glycosyltransferase involved in cell wall biosynthesis [Bacteriovoracaceae bacterium]|jgi:glycosyltransferase involved in cell wall biosynthesis
MDTKKIKIARVATVPISLMGSRNVLSYISKEFDLQVVCSEGEAFEEVQSYLNNPIKKIQIKREISPCSDLISTWRLIKYFRRRKIDISHSNTPKAGVICAIAAFLVRVPVRCHTFTGQRWATLSGFKRLLLMTCDRLICKLNTHVYADSESQIKFLSQNKIPGKKSLICLGQGGFAGVDLERYSKTRLKKDTLPRILEPIAGKFIISFVGRIVKEKGIEELLRSFSRLKERGLNIGLLLIGSFEEELDPISNECKEVIQKYEEIVHAGYLSYPEELLAYSSVLCLPSYREGFPMVVLEAASLGIPSIVSEIPGNIDTVVNNETGLWFELGNDKNIDSAIEKLYLNPNLCESFGAKARERVVDHFTDLALQKEFSEEYIRIFKNRRS